MAPTAPPETDPVRVRHRDLEQIALIALRCARLLMQSGSSGRVIHQCGALLARSQGVELLGLRVGYASTSITLGRDGNSITRMVTVAGHGVNHRLDLAVRALVREAARTGMAPAEIDTRLDALLAGTPRYPGWLVAIAVGVACAAFAGLLGADARAMLATLLASAIGQALRQTMHRRGNNVFVIVAAVALLSALLGGLGARLAGSGTVDLALFGATLLLVPGVPATNAQVDIMDGFPTLGSARAVSVLMVMVFVAIGIWLAQMVLGMQT
jgi:uncharacterized membrane protein YjjP (DUF1212 family)